jgi:hypothetical protein
LKPFGDGGGIVENDLAPFQLTPDEVRVLDGPVMDRVNHDVGGRVPLDAVRHGCKSHLEVGIETARDVDHPSSTRETGRRACGEARSVAPGPLSGRVFFMEQH